MKTILITIATLVSATSFAQTNYDQEMIQAFDSWKKGNKAASEEFQKVEKNHQSEWLPKYYTAFTQTLQAFEPGDNLDKQNLIDQAKVIINQLEKMQPNNAEILNLKALNLTAEIVLNPMVNGMILMDDVNSTYAKAILLNPTNPRSILGKAEFNIQAAEFVGGDITNDCKAVKKALALFETEKVGKFEPNWGKDRAENLMENECKNH